MSLTLTLCLFCAIVMDARASLNISPKMGDERCKRADSCIGKSSKPARQEWSQWGEKQAVHSSGHVKAKPAAL